MRQELRISRKTGKKIKKIERKIKTGTLSNFGCVEKWDGDRGRWDVGTWGRGSEIQKFSLGLGFILEKSISPPVTEFDCETKQKT